jgi:hypothetical protein
MNFFTRLLSTAAVAVALTAATASTASAARQVEHPTGYSCANGQIAIPPARVWSNPGRPEQVFWVLGIERWNGARWVGYSNWKFVSTFNYYGQNVTGWTGGRFVNSRMRIPVAHRGFYRVGSALAAPGHSSAVYIAGAGAYCQMA